MDGVFASPAKRQRVCADPTIDAGFGGKAAAFNHPSKEPISTMSTPHKQQKQQLQGSSADDSLLALSPQQLAPNLLVLNQILGALYVTLPMVRGRGRAATFANLRGPVQNFCGRDFSVAHVQQIKALCPEALGWEHVLAANPSTKRVEQQLVLSMPTDGANPKQPADTTALQQRFFARLQQHQACAGPKAAELSLAPLPPAAAPSTRDFTPARQRSGSSSGLLPSTPQTAPPAASHGAASNSLLLSPPPKRLATAARAPAAPGGGLLMSPPPARSTRRQLAAAAAAGDSGSSDAFTFSPAAPRQPLLSPRGGDGAAASAGRRGGGGLLTPARSPHEPAAAAASLDAGSNTPAAALRPNRLFGDSTPAAATPQQESAARPNTHATPDAAAAAAAGAVAAGVKARRLTFDVAAPTSAAKARRAAAGGSAPDAPAAAAAAGGAAASRTKGGLKFELGASAMALLQQVSSAEVKQEAAQQAAVLEQQRALDMLPGSFEALRAVFGERGPCVRPRAEVAELLRQKSTCKGGMSPADAAGQLDLMARLAPEWLRIVTASGASLAGLTQSVRITRQLPWPAARQRLLAAAAEARSAGFGAAAAAVAADRAAEQEQAAALASAAVARASEGEEEEQEEQEDLAHAADQGAAAAAAAVNELGLEIPALPAQQQQQQRGGGSSSGKTAPAAAASSDDDMLSLLGGGGARAPAASEMPGAVLGALAFKAPPRPRRVTAKHHS